MTPDEIRQLSPEDLILWGGFDCACGKRHASALRHVIIETGAIRRIPELLRECGASMPFILSGHDSFAAAGSAVCGALDDASVPYRKFVFPASPVIPNEASVGAAVMHYDPQCDIIIGVGSGVINDIGKLLACTAGKRYIIVGTAPSMDGYASATSSMERDGLKVSLNSTCPWAIIGDVDVLRNAPLRMLQAGVGDMLAKYVSITEWKISNIINDEYFCPTVATLVDSALEKVVRSASALIERDADAVRSVMEGLIIAGISMQYAGLSRPASGMEHYFSHLWDMRALAFSDARCDLHGIQCGIATVYALRFYEYLRSVTPDRAAAKRYSERFSADDWNARLRSFVGPGAEAMITAEKKDGKYSLEKHAPRLERILDRWDAILDIIGRMPSSESVLKLLSDIGAPLSAEEFGYTADQLRTTFTMTKDIRDKYVGSRLAWDLGLTEEASQAVFP